MHLVYIVRPGQNEELRFSLRSVTANLPVESVTIVGDAPDWVTGVRRIPGNRHGRDKPRNVLDNVRILAGAVDLPDEVVVMNDDFYVLRPMSKIPVLYRGSLADHITSCAGVSWWSLSLQNTLAWLQAQGHDDPLSYDLHVPFPINRGAMREALARLGDTNAANPPQWRTVYGNVAGIGGIRHGDQKIAVPTRRLPDGPFVSTDDGAFYVGLASALRDRFPHPSEFEARKRNPRKDTPVTLYQNVTTKMIVEDNSGRLDGIARWKKLEDADLAALEATDSDGGTGDGPASTEPEDGAESTENGDPAPDPQGDAAEPTAADVEPEKPKRTRTKKAD